MKEIAFNCRHCGAVGNDVEKTTCWHCGEPYYDRRFWRNARFLLAAGVVLVALALAYILFVVVFLLLNGVAS